MWPLCGDGLRFELMSKFFLTVTVDFVRPISFTDIFLCSGNTKYSATCSGSCLLLKTCSLKGKTFLLEEKTGFLLLGEITQSMIF